MTLLVVQAQYLSHAAVGCNSVEEGEEERAYISQYRFLYFIDHRKDKKGCGYMNKFSDAFAFQDMEAVCNVSHQGFQAYIESTQYDYNPTSHKQNVTPNGETCPPV